MNFPFYIARKYFKAKKSQQAINVITLIAIAGVAIGTMGLIIVLSVFNGFEQLVVSLYNSFDPDIQITAAKGKVFDSKLITDAQLKEVKGVRYITHVLEENALLKYRDKQYLATIKGVSNDFIAMTGVDSMLYDGSLTLQRGDTDYAIAGRAIAEALTINIADPFSILDVYMPKRGKVVSLNPEAAFNQELIAPAGVFSIQQDFDAKYVLVPLRFARKMLDYKTEVSAIEIGLDKGSDADVAKAALANKLGPNYVVKTRIQLHELLYKIMKSEKWAVYLILSFILIIATFNVISSLAMLIIDKQSDIAILNSLGAHQDDIRKIFLLEGILISFSGAFIGLALGLAVCLAQIKFQLIKLGGAFVVDAYPVNLQLMDFVYVLLTVLSIGLFAAWYPAKKMIGKGENISGLL